MKNSTFSAQVANNLLKVLQGYTKGIRFIALLTILCTIGVGNAWGAETIIYTLDGNTTGGSNSYADASDITQNNVSWSVVGNTTMSPWRIGGKSLTNTDRTIASTTSIASNISKVVVSHGTASSVTVNSLKLIVASDASFSNVVSTVTGEFTASKTTTFICPNNADWTNMYYKFVYNITISGTSNKYLQFNSATFYGEESQTGGGSTPEPEPDPEPGDADAYKLITSTAELEAGAKYVIGNASSSSAVFMSNATNTNNRKQTASITITDSQISATDEVLVLELGGTTGAWTFLTTNYTSTNGYLTSAASGNNNYCKVVANAESCSYFTISFTDNAAVITSTGRDVRNVLRYNSSSSIFACYTSGQNPVYLYKLVEAGTPEKPAAPAFTVAGGSYYGTQSIEITCATAGANIYYTLDGSVPTSSSTPYTGAISISETKTLKAIAIKGENSSSVTEATYTILAPLATMQEIFDKATAVGGTATPVKVTMNNWVVTGVKNSNAYVTDGTKGFIIYTASHGFLAGDILSGTVSCKVQLYKGSAELTELTSTTTGLTVSKGGEVTPIELDEEGIATLTGINTGSVIKINGTCSQGNIISDIQLYNTLYSFEDLTVGAKYDVTGVYLLFESTKEILPRGAEDIVKTQDLLTATISIANISLEIEKQATIEATITPDAAKNTVTYTIKSGDEYITLNGTTITAKAVGEATITATIPESIGNYFGTTKDFTVTVTPKNIATLPFTFDGGKAEIENTLGISQKGLDDDYASSPKLKFDGTGDYVIIHFDSEPGMLSYDIKGNSYSGGTFTVQESADGSAYTNIVEYTELGSTDTKTHTLAATSRYVKFIYTEKVNGNVALGNIKIYSPASQLETPTGLKATNVTHNSATLSWNAVTNASSYIVEVYGKNDNVIATYNDITETSTEVSGLNPSTYYVFGVVAVGDGITYTNSIQAVSDVFTTTAAPIVTYTVTLDPNYPIGETGTFIDTLENSVVGNLEIPFSAGTDSIAIASLYKSIALDGYIFEGWYTAADGGSKRVTTGTISANITFYAHWKVPYTVTFNAGTGNCATESITETTANGITLPTATLTDCGDWVFLGWAENAIASETTAPPASILAGGSTYKPTGNITLYAIYKRVESGGNGEGTAATLTFDNTSKRTTLTTEQQVWEENGITLTNNKASSTSNVADYSNPALFYAKSEIIISAPANITQIVASTSESDYTIALKSSVGAEASATGNVVTITPEASSATYTIQLTGGQTRLKSIAVTYGGNASTSYYHSTPNCQVTITYYGFGGGYTTDCETDPVIVITKGDTYQIPNCEPTDYDNTLNRTFAGTWNTKANGKGTAYKPGEEFIVNSDIILYAQWTLNTIGNTTLPTGEELLANTDIVVTGGNTLTLQAGTTTIKSLTLKGGIQSDGEYKMPIINIPAGATLVRNNNKINLDLKVNNQSYYPFAVPFEVMNDKDYIHYLDTNLNKVATYGKHYQVLTYDGALRAENGVHDKNWTEVNRHDAKKPSYLVPGKGYAISAVPAAGKDTVTIRISMSVDNKWLANGEQYQLDTITRNQIAVSAHAGAAATEHRRHAGWNFVANPYLANFAGTNASGSFINGEILINKGDYSYSDEEVPYVTIPTYNFAHYYQVKLSEATLSPAYSFFVQVGESGTMTFDVAGRQAAPASIAARNAEERPVKMDVDITLSDNHSSDQTGIIISDRYSDAYEIGRDLEKLFGSANNLTVYTLMADNTPLAYQALAIRSNMQVIPVGYRAPEQGEYTFRLNEATSSIDLLNEQYEQLVLVDYQTGELTNLLISDYTFYSERIQADNRFAIYAVPRQNAPTDLPNAIGQDKQAQKIIHNGHLYILRDGNVYNGNGQIVK